MRRNRNKFFPEKELEKRFKRTKMKWNFFEKYFISETFIEKHINDIDDMGWLSISFHQSLHLEFILKHKDKLQFTQSIIYGRHLNNFDLVKKYKNELNWVAISQYKHLSQEFIHMFAEYLNWEEVCKYSHLSEFTLTMYSHLLHWENVSCYQNLSTSFMESFSKYLNWEWISKKQRLSLGFIEKYANLLNWKKLCCRSGLRLSSKFLEKHMDKINDNDLWDYIGHQKLDSWFVEKYQHKITRWGKILRNCDLPEQVIENNKDKFNSTHWFWIAKKQKISVDFIINNMDNISFRVLRSNYKINQDELNKKGIYVMATLCGKLA